MIPRPDGTDKIAQAWNERRGVLRAEDCGNLWEHLVLDELAFEIPADELHYWRDKQGAEVDFVWKAHGKLPVAIERKWRAEQTNGRAQATFPSLYPDACCSSCGEKGLSCKPQSAEDYRRSMLHKEQALADFTHEVISARPRLFFGFFFFLNLCAS